jgi:hypothetical protein
MSQTPPPTAIETISELKPWPLGGYAPGHYICECISCGNEFEGDKRAYQCLDCAAKSVNSALSRRSLDTADGVDSDSLRFLRQFADQYREGASGCTMDFNAAQALALSIDDILASRPTRNAEVGVLPKYTRLDATGDRAYVDHPAGGVVHWHEYKQLLDHLLPYKAELLKIAEQVGEPDDPFAAWESINRSTLAITDPERGEQKPDAWQWSDFSGNWYTVDTNLSRMSLSEQEGIAIASAAAHAGRVRPLFASPPAQEAVTVTDEMVAEAMHEAWNEICSDTGCHPLDIERHGKELFFHPLHWSRFTAMHLRAALQLGKEG